MQEKFWCQPPLCVRGLIPVLGRCLLSRHLWGRFTLQIRALPRTWFGEGTSPLSANALERGILLIKRTFLDFRIVKVTLEGCFQVSLVESDRQIAQLHKLCL